LLSTSGYVCGQTSLWHVDELHANGGRRQARVSGGYLAAGKAVVLKGKPGRQMAVCRLFGAFQ
jgi:hypothetical protein